MDKLNFGGIRNQNKPKNSVASELISALTKPKVKDIKQEKIDEFSRVFGKELNNVKTKKEDINPVKLARNSPSSRFNSSSTPSVITSFVSSSSTSYSRPTISNPSPVVSPTSGSSSFPPVVEATKKKVVNDDWLNFLKKKQDIDPKMDPTDSDINDKVIPPKSEKVVKSKPPPKEALLVPKQEIIEGSAEKDKILKNLLNQVSGLEASMGASISKLEHQLKAEQEKNVKLKVIVDDQKENNDKLIAEISEMKKASNSEDSVRKEKEMKELKLVNAELLDKTVKLEEAVKVEKRIIEKISKNLKSSNSANSILTKKIAESTKWKSENLIRIKNAKIQCEKDHVERINDLEEKLDWRGDILSKLAFKVRMLMMEHSTTLKSKDKLIKELNEKLENREDVTREGEREFLLTEKNNIKMREDKLKERENALILNEKRLKEHIAEMEKAFEEEKGLAEVLDSVAGSRICNVNRNQKDIIGDKLTKEVSAADESDDDVECVMEVPSVGKMKELQIKEAVKNLITKSSLEHFSREVMVSCPEQRETYLDMSESRKEVMISVENCVVEVPVEDSVETFVKVFLILLMIVKIMYS